MIFLALSALLAFLAPASTWSNQLPAYHAPALPSFLGIEVGEKATAVDAKFGTPTLVKTAGDGEFRVYNLASGVALIVKVHDGLIVLVGAGLRPKMFADITDPYGVAIGAAADTIQLRRGTPLATLSNGSLEYNASPAGHWFYRVDDGKVTDISLTISYEALGLTKTDDAGRDGSNVATAIVITAKTETDGITAEHDYIAKQPCANGGTWLWTKQSVRAAGSLKYDQIDTKCSSSDDSRSFFFDITSFFGRLGD
ncbi:MAG TPA: hypothetical protein VII69_02550 [Candidatus Eremiobacteraceae bacterium]